MTKTSFTKIIVKFYLFIRSPTLNDSSAAWLIKNRMENIVQATKENYTNFVCKCLGLCANFSWFFTNKRIKPGKVYHVFNNLVVKYRRRKKNTQEMLPSEYFIN